MRAHDNDPHINRPLRVFGVNIIDLMILMGTLIITILFLGILNAFLGIVSPMIFPFVFLFYFVVFFVLKRANKKGYHGYLISLFAFRFFQPKTFRVKPKKIRTDEFS